MAKRKKATPAAVDESFDDEPYAPEVAEPEPEPEPAPDTAPPPPPENNHAWISLSGVPNVS